MEIKQVLTTVNRTVKSSRTIKYIVVHYVGAVSTALANANYFKSVNRGASAHYFVDDTSIYQSVLDKDVAWAVGGGIRSDHHPLYGIATNSNTLSIEMCCVLKNGAIAISDKTIANTIELIKAKMKEHNIDVAHIVRHYDVNGKLCPNANGLLVDANFNAFKAKLSATGTITPTATQSSNTSTTLKYSEFDKVIQNTLNVLGYKGTDGNALVADGLKGANTIYAIKSFQKDMGLAQDGNVAGNTRTAIDQIMARPTVSNANYATYKYATRYIQKRVGATVDGIFGTGTLAKVKAWQTANKLIADGVVGAKSWAVML